MIVAARIKQILTLYDKNKQLTNTINHALQTFPESVIVHTDADTPQILFANNNATQNLLDDNHCLLTELDLDFKCFSIKISENEEESKIESDDDYK